MLELAIGFIVFCVGFNLGWKGREKHAQRILDAHFEEVADDSIKIEISNHNDIFYVHNMETKAFIVQVKTQEELLNYFKEKHPNKTVIVDKENMNKMFGEL